MSQNENATTRRNIVKGAVWSMPVIAVAVAVAAPAASASNGTEVCVNGAVSALALGWTKEGALVSNWGEETTTGWFGSFSDSPGGNATKNGSGVVNGFLSQDDNDSATSTATVTMQVQVSVIDGATYMFDLKTGVGFGIPGGSDGSARQSMVLNVVQPNSSSDTLLKLTVNHWAAAAIVPSDADMRADGYVLQDQSSTEERKGLTFTAQGTGTATLEFTFTIQPRIGDNRTDDISVEIPATINQICAA